MFLRGLEFLKRKSQNDFEGVKYKKFKFSVMENKILNVVFSTSNYGIKKLLEVIEPLPDENECSTYDIKPGFLEDLRNVERTIQIAQFCNAIKVAKSRSRVIIWKPNMEVTVTRSLLETDNPKKIIQECKQNFFATPFGVNFVDFVFKI